MDRATYNNIRLKAYYWEKQILRGREDQKAQKQFAHYSAQLDAAKEQLAAQKEKEKAEKAEEAKRKALEWRKNVRRACGSKPYDAWTQNALSTSLSNWQPPTEVVFD